MCVSRKPDRIGAGRAVLGHPRSSDTRGLHVVKTFDVLSLEPVDCLRLVQRFDVNRLEFG